jgi:hypothetical protein
MDTDNGLSANSMRIIRCSKQDIQKFLSVTKEFGILKSLLVENFFFVMRLFDVLIFKLRNLLDIIIYWQVTYHFLVKISCKGLIIRVRAAIYGMQCKIIIFSCSSSLLNQFLISICYSTI